MKAADDAIVVREASIDVSATPAQVYDLVADISRMGEWSPEATGGVWTQGSGEVGDWFDGTNKAGEREWTRECEVAAADRGRDFTFVVGGVEANRTWWSFEMQPAEDGVTQLTERWWIVNKSPAMLEATDEQFTQRIALTEEMLATTIAGLKRAAEAASG